MVHQLTLLNGLTIFRASTPSTLPSSRLLPPTGLYLSDLTYTNVAHPRVAGKTTDAWSSKINAIINTIAHFQQSEYRQFLTPLTMFVFRSYVDDH